jgi:hypothetical protein
LVITGPDYYSPGSVNKISRYDKKNIIRNGLSPVSYQGYKPPVFTGSLGPAKEAAGMLNNYNRHLDPLKVYLHVNKNNYYAGESVWFQAYLLDGRNHLPDTSATNLYVELVSRDGELMAKRILLAEKGRAEGDIVLPYDISDGNYMIRAYTDRMRNFDEEFYYTRHLYIHNQGYANMIPRSEIRSNRRFNNRLESMHDTREIFFFPEGGEMIGGIPVKVTFKAVDGLGNGIEVKGEVLDGSEVVAVFESDQGGIGNFEFKPDAGTDYTARVSFGGDRPQNHSLPKVLAEGTTLRVIQDEENIKIDIFSAGLSTSEEEVLLVAHTRGEVISTTRIRLNAGEAGISLPRDRFPSGIAHLTLFSGDWVPLSERLVFIDHRDAFVFYPRVIRQTFENRDYYLLTLNVTDKDGKPVKGTFSLSVLQDDGGAGGAAGSRGNILSYMLISSDLPGITHDIHNYLDPELDLSAALDNLMLTSGWRRFEWDDVLSGGMPEMEHQASSSLAISGRVMHPAGERAVPNFPVRLDIRGENGSFETRTDNNGVFLFDDLLFYDDTSIRISSDRTIAKSPPDFELYSAQITGIDYVPGIHTLPQQITRRGDEWTRTPGAGRSPLARKRDDGISPSQYGVADQTIFIDPEPRQTSMYDILVTRVRGLNHNLQFRGPTSMHLSNTPTYILDGSEVGQNVFLTLDPRYVQRIEVFSGPRASIFGVRGAAGAILAYSRRPGDPGMPDYEEYLIQGYHSAREFHSDLLPVHAPGNRQGVPERSLLWKTDLVTDESGNITVSMPVSTASGMLKFIVEGAGFEGGIGFGVFSVQPQ